MAVICPIAALRSVPKYSRTSVYAPLLNRLAPYYQTNYGHLESTSQLILDCGFRIVKYRLWKADFYNTACGLTPYFLLLMVLFPIIFSLIGLAGSHHYANRMQGFDVFADDFNGGRNRY